MDLQQLRAIIAIAETGSVTKAAERLNIVQPALSRRVRLLEETLGKRIFDRTHAGMRLTEEGERMVQVAKQALFLLYQAIADIGETEHSISGVVTVGLLPSTCELLAGDLVHVVKDRFPKVRLRLCSGYAGELQEWVESGVADIALLYDPRESASVQIRPLLDEPLFLVGLRGSEVEWRDHAPLSILARLPLIVPTGTHSIRGLIERACADSQIPLNIVAEADDSPLTKALLMAGVGYTVLAGIAVAEDLQRNRIAAVPIGKPSLQRRVAMVIAAGSRLTEPAACVADLFEARVKEIVRQNRWPGARLVDFD